MGPELLEEAESYILAGAGRALPSGGVRLLNSSGKLILLVSSRCEWRDRGSGWPSVAGGPDDAAAAPASGVS